MTPVPNGESSPEERIVTRERVMQMWKVVERLSERQRTVFTLRYGKEQDLGEIARATGLHESSVKAHLWRAGARVRAELGGRL